VWPRSNQTSYRSLRELQTPSWSDEVACTQSSNRVGFKQLLRELIARRTPCKFPKFGERLELEHLGSTRLSHTARNMPPMRRP
jgi:hypothetical protein